MLRFIVHYFLHLVAPFGVARVLVGKSWLRVGLVFLATMAVDLDHLLSDPVYDAARCSIGHHPLHGVPTLLVCCVALAAPAPWRWVALGLLMHLGTDLLDCVWIQG